VQYIYRDLGHRRRGDVVQFNLTGNQANIGLLDSSNYSAFRNGRNFRGVLRLATGSPVRLAIPNSAHWYGVIYIPPGHTGQVRGSIGLLTIPDLPPRIGPSRTSPSPLGSIREAAEDFSGSFADADLPDTEYDVFICHAGEDKDEVVRPLAHALRARDVEVWYDEFVLKIGDSLRRKIDKGLIACRFGVVVLSPSFFGKGWPNHELDGLVIREVAGNRQLILPIWHNVTKADVIGYSPSLADKLARSTSDMTIDELADEIAGVIIPAEDAD
jgi:TIR domain/Domain of unknown function (DUF1883)